MFWMGIPDVFQGGRSGVFNTENELYLLGNPGGAFGGLGKPGGGNGMLNPGGGGNGILGKGGNGGIEPFGGGKGFMLL